MISNDANTAAIEAAADELQALPDRLVQGWGQWQLHECLLVHAGCDYRVCWVRGAPDRIPAGFVGVRIEDLRDYEQAKRDIFDGLQMGLLERRCLCGDITAKLGPDELASLTPVQAARREIEDVRAGHAAQASVVGDIDEFALHTHVAARLQELIEEIDRMWGEQ